MLTQGVRLAGKITEWNDARGFGFVMPNGGGDRAFIHVKSLAQGCRGLVPGEIVSYFPATDARGRLQASDVRRAAAKAAAPKARRRRIPWRMSLGIVCLAAIAVFAYIGAVPAHVGGLYAAMSAISWLLYRGDKQAALAHRQRTPENTLHFADLLGGWPGALVAQQQFHHKTLKVTFNVLFWLTVLFNITLMAWVVRMVRHSVQ